jgi:hypothetical protein
MSVFCLSLESERFTFLLHYWPLHYGMTGYS